MPEEVKNEIKKTLIDSIVKGGPNMVIMSIFCWFLYTQNAQYSKQMQARQIELEQQLKECHQSKIELLMAHQQNQN